MHGVIFSELKKFVQDRHGNQAWKELAQRAELSTEFYVPLKTYPDEDASNLVAAAADLTGKPASELLEEFGEFIAPNLLGMYRSLIRPEWKTLDLIEHTEETIHRVVRARKPGADPPKLDCERTAPDRIDIVYTSERRMCGVAKGIVKGIASHYDEEVAITESDCMLNGAQQCRMSVLLAA